MGVGRLGTGGRKSLRSPSLEALSAAADAGEVERRVVRARRAQTRAQPVPRPGGRDFAGLPGTTSLRALRLLSGLRMRDGREVESAPDHGAAGSRDRALRNPAR